MHKYDRGKVLGKGSFGRAVLATKRSDGSQVVIKEVSMRSMKPAEREAAKQEAELLKALQHPNIVSCHESFVEGTTLCIVMDYCDGGDLHVALQQRRGAALTESAILDYFVQLCLALKHLHDKKILHRDVKTQNIFLGRTGIVKVGDLGVSKVLDSTTALAATGVGTPYYLSPEICHGRRYNFKTDVWSAGCVLYELTCLRRPFEGPDMRTLISKIVRGAYPPPPPRYSADLRALIDAMLRRDPAQRLSIGAVLRRPVMQARIRKFLSESAAQGQLGATAAGALPPPAPAAAPAGGLRRPPVDLRPPLNPLGGGARDSPLLAAAAAAAPGGRPMHAPPPDHAAIAQQARRLAARRQEQQQERLQRDRERAEEVLQRQREARAEERRRSREAAQMMREEFANRQAQALRNKAAAEADRGHVAIYMPPRPRPAAAQPPAPPGLPPAPQPQRRPGPPSPEPSNQHGLRRQSADGVAGSPGARGGGMEAAGVRNAAAGRRRTEDAQPVGGRMSANEQLSPEQRRAVYLENKCAARRNREALLAEAGAGALAAFVGVPDDTKAAPAAGYATPPPPPPPAAWGPRYSSGGESDGPSARAAGSVAWAPQSTWGGPTCTAAFSPRLDPADGTEQRRPPLLPPADRPSRSPWSVDPPVELSRILPGLPPHVVPANAPCGYSGAAPGDSAGAVSAGTELNVFQVAADGAWGRREEPRSDADGTEGTDAAAWQARPVDLRSEEAPARPARRSWSGAGDVVTGLSHLLAQQDAAAREQDGSGELTGTVDDSPMKGPHACGEAGLLGGGERVSAGDRSVSPWPQVADVDPGGWQPAAEVHAHSGMSGDLHPGSPQIGAAEGASRAILPVSDTTGFRWGRAAEPAVGQGTGRMLTAGTGQWDTPGQTAAVLDIAEPAVRLAGVADMSPGVAASQPTTAAAPDTAPAATADAGAAAVEATAGFVDDTAGLLATAAAPACVPAAQVCASDANGCQLQQEDITDGGAADGPHDRESSRSAADGAEHGPSLSSQSEITLARGQGGAAALVPWRATGHTASAGGQGCTGRTGERPGSAEHTAGTACAAVDRGSSRNESEAGGAGTLNAAECDARERPASGDGSRGRGGGRRSSGGMGAYEAMVRDMAAALCGGGGSEGSSLEGSSGSSQGGGGGGSAVQELQERVSDGHFMMNGEKVELPVGSSASLPQKVESLRMLLEAALGTDAFLAVYRCMERLHDGADAAAAADRLRALVGPGQEGYLQLAHQLIVSEEVMHACSAAGNGGGGGA